MKSTLSSDKSLHVLIVPLILALAALARYPCVLYVPFYNSDTAVLDLMARHLSRGERYLYYWRETYYGAVDPWLLRPLFYLFGQTPQISQSLGFILSLIFIALFHHLVRRVAGPLVAHVAALLIAVPPPNVLGVFFTVYSYPITGIMALIQWELALTWLERPSDKILPLTLGLIAGFSWYYFHVIFFFWAAFAAGLWFSKAGQDVRRRFAEWWDAWDFWPDAIWLRQAKGRRAWVYGLRIISLLNVGVFLLALRLWRPGEIVYSWKFLHADRRFGPTLQIGITTSLILFALVKGRWLLAELRSFFRRRGLRWFTAGFLIGYGPALYGIATGRLPGSPGRYNAWPDIHINLKTLFGGIIPDYFGVHGPLWLDWPRWTFMGAGILWLYKPLRYAWRTGKAGIGPLLFPCLAVINFTLAILNVSLWDAHTARYLFPFFLSAAVGAGTVWQWLHRRQATVAWILLIGALAGQFRAEARQWHPADLAVSYRDLERHLSDKGVQGGYADYWIAYRVTAESHETTFIVPTGIDDRYPRYLAYVQSLRTPALLGQALPAWVKTITIKGFNYEITGEEYAHGWPIVYLQKIDSQSSQVR